MKLILSFVISLGLLSSMSAKANEAIIEAMGEYLMFQEYESGIILPQQIDQSVFEAVTWIDTIRQANNPGSHPYRVAPGHRAHGRNPNRSESDRLL
jgi:hypothetical protein